jgi:hypothetical protein
MSDTLGRVVQLIQEGRVLVSIHGYDEMAEDGILAVEAIEGAAVATVIEDLPRIRQGALYAGAATRPGRAPDPCGVGHPAGTGVASRAGYGLPA